MPRADIYILIFLTITTLYGYSTGIYTYVIRILCLIAARICYPYIANVVTGIRGPLLEVMGYYGFEQIAELLSKNAGIFDKVLYIISFIGAYIAMRIFSRIARNLLYPKRNFSRKLNQYLGLTLGFIFGIAVTYLVYSGIELLAGTGLPIGIEVKSHLDNSYIISVLCFVFRGLGV